MTKARGIRPNIKPVVGQRFGRLVVLRAGAGYVESCSGGVRRDWSCVCDCGAQTTVREMNLKNGHTRSCGCMNVDSEAQRAKHTNLQHGESRKGRRTPEFKAWLSLHDRCLNPKNQSFNDYGGRGITLCDRWRSSYETFLADMGRKPSPAHSIDREDNDRGYEPGNCRWATRSQQQRNRRCNRRLQFDGRTRLLVEWAEDLRIPMNVIGARLSREWTISRALTTPYTPRRAGGGVPSEF